MERAKFRLPYQNLMHRVSLQAHQVIRHQSQQKYIQTAPCQVVLSYLLSLLLQSAEQRHWAQQRLNRELADR